MITKVHGPNVKRKPNKGVKFLLGVVFSDFGLAVLIIFYIFFGAFLFQYLENDAVIQKCEEGKSRDKLSTKKYALLLYNFIGLNLTEEERLAVPFEEIKSIKENNETYVNMSKTDFNESDPTIQISRWLIDLRKEIHNISHEYKFSGQLCHENAWIFESSILFTITLVTTIGYGHLTPVTWDGQIVSICFSLIGIPLFLLWISRLSQVFGQLFRSCYSRLILLIKYIFCEKLCCCLKKNKKKKSITIEEFEQLNNKDKEDTSSIYSNESLNMFITGQFKISKPVKKVTIPVMLVLLILVCYVYIGSVVLFHLEGWNFHEAIYFSFVSMTTIGFGDFVPGIRNYKNENEKGTTDGLRILLGIVYLIFGIVVIAMCFDLIQEQLFIKWTKFKLFFESDESILEDDSEEEREKIIANYLMLTKNENDLLQND